jgi:hypothetical protein
VTNPADVEINGILAGSDAGQDIYVGKAIHNGASEPGELILGTSPTVRYGNSMFAYNATTNIQYLNKDPKCNYQWVGSSNGVLVTNAIVVAHRDDELYIGRLNAFGGTQVGKVGKVPPYNRFYYAYGDKELNAIDYYEVLVCSPIING